MREIQRRRENLRFPTDRLPTSPPPPPLTPLMTRKRRLVKATGEFNQNLLLNRTKGAKRHKYVFLSPSPQNVFLHVLSFFFNIRYGPLVHTCFISPFLVISLYSHLSFFPYSLGVFNFFPLLSLHPAPPLPRTILLFRPLDGNTRVTCASEVR